MENYPNHIAYGIERDPYITGEGWGDTDPIESNWSFKFTDGSRITLIPFEDAEIEVPRQRSKPYLAEEVFTVIQENAWDDEQTKRYILSNYENQ